MYVLTTWCLTSTSSQRHVHRLQTKPVYCYIFEKLHGYLVSARSLSTTSLCGRAMKDRFFRDSSLDRATRLKEAQERRARYLADLKKRDQDQQRGRRHYRDLIEHADYANERPGALLLDAAEASAISQEHREVYERSSRAPAAGTAAGAGQLQRRSQFPVRPSTTPAAAALGKSKSPVRLGSGPSPKENRQAATDRAVRVYSAGAGVTNGRHRHRSPTDGDTRGGDGVFRPSPAWDDSSPPPSTTEQQRRRLSPRENGRRPLPWPLDDGGVGGTGQVRNVFFVFAPRRDFMRSFP